MREKRLDIEEALVEEKKNNETLKKELESMNKKLKVIINALKTAQNDLEAFQVCRFYTYFKNTYISTHAKTKDCLYCDLINILFLTVQQLLMTNSFKIYK